MTEQIENLLNEIREYIAEATELVAKEDTFALEGLDEKVKTLCEALQAVPVRDAQPYIDELSGMSEQLDELQSKMIEKRDVVGERINDISKHRQASKAYGQSSQSVSGRPPSEGE